MMRKVLLHVAFLMAGCHHEYRLLDDNLQPFKALRARTEVPLPLPMVEHNAGFDTVYIEFDDQGRMFDRGAAPHQATETLSLIRKNRPGTIIFYVHGWNNNASDNSADVTRFRAGMNYLSRQRKLPGPFRGIYIGWRGGMLKGGVLGPFTFLTYWSRKEAARRMGIGDLPSLIDELVKTERDVRPASRFFAIGHSFGARVLEGALQDSVQFTSVFDALANGSRDYRPPIDLVLLINPATDSMLTRQLVEHLEKVNTHKFVVHHPDWKPGVCGQSGTDRNSRLCHPYPLMVEMSSERDIPTGIAMPLANAVNWIPPMPFVSRPRARLRSAPFTPGLRTHSLHLCKPLDTTTADPCGDMGELVEFDFPLPASPATIWHSVSDGDYWGRVERTDHYKSQFVWVLKVNREISESHGDIWNANVTAMMLALLDPEGSRVYTPAMVAPPTHARESAAAVSQRRLSAPLLSPGTNPWLQLWQQSPGLRAGTENPYQVWTEAAPQTIRRPQIGPQD